MDAVGALLVVVALGIAVAVLGVPLLPGRTERAVERDELRRADLEVAKVAKYREIRDAELDHATGKLSDEDHRAIDRRLRSEAVALLDELDELGPATERGGEPGDERDDEARGGATL